MIEILQIVGFLICGFLAPIFLLLDGRFFVAPIGYGGEMQRTPYHKSGPLYEQFWNHR